MAVTHDYHDQLTTAIYKCLTDDAQLMSRLESPGVYNYVEEGIKSPYIGIGRFTSSNRGDHDYNGQAIVSPIDIFWGEDDLKVGNLILADVIRILDRKDDLEMPDFCTRWLQYESGDHFINVDNELQLRSIVARFLIIITEKT